jgi:hypothetical protein
MTRLRFPTLVAALAIAFSPALPADEVADQINTATKDYQAGQLRQAVQDLQYAIAQIQEQLNAQYTKLMPAALPGWQAEEPQARSAGMAVMGGGTQVSRNYTKEGGGESVEIQLTADSPFLQAMAMMLANPMMMSSDPSTKLYHQGRYRGMIKHEAGSQDWEIDLMVANRILVQVTGHGMQDRSAAEAYLKALDLAAVEKAFSQ